MSQRAGGTHSPGARDTDAGEETPPPSTRSAGIYAIFAREAQAHEQAVHEAVAAFERGEPAATLIARSAAALERWLHDAGLLRLEALSAAVVALQQRVRGWGGGLGAAQATLLRGWVARLRELSEEVASRTPPPRALRELGELAAEVAAGPRSRRADATAAGRRILVCDESPITGEVIQQELRGRGHAVALVRNEAEFEERMCSFAPDALLLDVGGPRRAGDALCRRVRASYPRGSLAVLLLADLAPPELARLAAAGGADGCLSKNQGLEQLVRQVEQLLADAG